jgi:hypothetical protein
VPFGGRARVHLAGDHLELWPGGAGSAGTNGNGGQQR